MVAIIVTEAYIYYNRYPQDRPLLKYAVGVWGILEDSHS